MLEAAQHSQFSSLCEHFSPTVRLVSGKFVGQKGSTSTIQEPCRVSESVGLTAVMTCLLGPAAEAMSTAILISEP